MDNTNVQVENAIAPVNGEVGKLFRSTVRGFHKQDVTDYIERMARDRRRDAERYSAHIRSLEEERELTSQELVKLRGQIAEYTYSSFEVEKDKDDLRTEADNLKEENAVLQKEVEALMGQLEEALLPAEQDDTLAQELEATKQELYNTQAALATAKEMLEEGTKSQALLAEKDAEIRRLRGKIAGLEEQGDTLAAELRSLRRRPEKSVAMPALGSSQDLVDRVRRKYNSSENAERSAEELAELRRRVQQARECAQEGIAECNALYTEMHRNIARLEEILRELEG